MLLDASYCLWSALLCAPAPVQYVSIYFIHRYLSLFLSISQRKAAKRGRALIYSLTIVDFFPFFSKKLKMGTMVKGDKLREKKRERESEVRTSDSIDLTAGHLERRLKRQVLFSCVFLLVRLMEMGGSIFFKPKYFFWDCWGVRTKSGYGCGQSREARLDLLVITKITQDVLPTNYSVHTCYG